MNSSTNPSRKLLIGKIIEEAWALTLTRGMIWTVFKILLLIVVIGIAIVGGISFAIGLVDFGASGPGASGVVAALGMVFLLYLLSMPLFYFLIWFPMCMLSILGIRQAIGLFSTIETLWLDCKKMAGPLILLWLFSFLFLITDLVIVFFVPSPINLLIHLLFVFILFLIHTFAIPLVIIKRCSVFNAIAQSLKVGKEFFGTLFIFLILVAILNNLSLFILGIGLILTVPMTILMQGILFREIFNLKKKTASVPTSPAVSPESPT